MIDQPFYAPTRSPAPRQPRLGEPLWPVQKDGRQLACELGDDGDLGVEAQVHRDGELLYGRRWPTRAETSRRQGARGPEGGLDR